ncbi:MAG TPA: BrnT family toxin [Candidatus Kapabacteria bacterium]|nr:BrnT family toxin [Candidatus Kapabacteria bacterium]
MSPITFSWDDNKNKDNIKKHKTSFEEARSVFFDESAIEYFDPDHSENEDRFLMLGLSYRFRILVVCFCLRKGDSEIRIISARKATKKEQAVYRGGKQNEERI